MKKIHGIHEGSYWIAFYDKWGVNLAQKFPAYDNKGSLSEQVKKYALDFELSLDDIHHGCTPLEAVVDILSEEFVNEYLTPETQDELVNLFKK